VTLVPDKILGMETIFKMQRFASKFGDDHGLSVFVVVYVCRYLITNLKMQDRKGCQGLELLGNSWKSYSTHRMVPQ